uniref:Glucosylceramidase n=1 Tax=Heliothis virescens TaxID=7102 RepID=A0A2A4K8P8_HELVI
MDAHKICVLVSVLCMCVAVGFGADDTPCLARKISKKSVVCVCNTTYCDTVTREPLASYSYTAYTSSLSGLRFNKTHAALKRLNYTDVGCSTTLVLHPDTMYQTVEGFGGAVTDAAAINWKGLSEPLQKYLIDSYFSDTGLEYNMLRVPIGGSDFSTHAYAYNELPTDDVNLTNYTLSSEDLNYKIPMIKASMQASSTPIHVIATTWSPPPWMKSNNAYTGHSSLKPQYYQTYADYHYKFLQKYSEKGIPIWGITTTNEPTSGLVGFLNSINNLGWTAENLMIKEHPKVLDYIDGIAVHYYTDFITPAAVLTEVSKSYPEKFIIATEACEGTMLFEKLHVDIGSWVRAKKYIIDIIDLFESSRFLQKYSEKGIPIWGITTTNEPTSGLVGFLNSINNLGWTAENLGKWIVNHLGPTLRNSTFKDVKILAGDDQRLTLPYWVNVMIKEHPKVLDYIDGIAVHYYTDFITPAAVLTEVSKSYPEKFIIATEACEGTMLFEKLHVDIGSWVRAKKYIIDIIDDMNHNVVGWIDWNLCLNVQGGPNYIENFADSPIIVFPERNVFIKQPMFYAMGHFSKFVPRGSRRIGVTRKCGWGPSVWNVAFMTPRQNVVVVLYNDHNKAVKVNLQINDNQATLVMVPNSVTTVELPPYL